MKIISHRANLSGPNKKLENNPSQVLKVLKMGFDCEVDVWLIKNFFFLGHDNIKNKLYPIKSSFLKKKGLWCHAKNYEAFEYLVKNNIHCFWHENDYVTLTSKKWKWCHPRCKRGGKKSIAVLPELNNVNIKFFSGICTDEVFKYISD